MTLSRESILRLLDENPDTVVDIILSGRSGKAD